MAEKKKSGKITEKYSGDTERVVRPELAEALKDLLAYGIDISVTSLRRVERGDRSRWIHSAHSTGAAFDLVHSDNSAFFEFLFNDPNADPPLIQFDKDNFNSKDMKNWKLSPKAEVWCKKHNIMVFDEYNVPNSGKGGRRVISDHLHIEVQTKDGNSIRRQGKTKIRTDYDENFGERKNLNRTMDDGYGAYKDVYEGTGYWGQNDEQFTTNEYNSTPEYKENIEQNADDHDYNTGLKDEIYIDIDKLSEDAKTRVDNNDIPTFEGTPTNTHELVLDTYTDERGSNLLPSIISDLESKGYKVETRKDKNGKLNQDVIYFENEEDANKARDYVRNQVTYDGSLDVYTQKIQTTTQQPTDETTTPETTTPETTNNQITIVVENNRDFEENPITKEEVQNVVNYQRDSDQLKQDFKDGKLPYNSLFIIDGVLYKKGFDDSVHEYDRESRTFDDQRQFPTVIDDLEFDELPVPTPEDPGDAIKEFENRGKSRENEDVEEIIEPEEEFPEPISKPNRTDYPLDPNKKSEGRFNPLTKGKTYNEALEEYNKQEAERKEREERVKRETTTVTPSDTDENRNIIAEDDSDNEFLTNELNKIAEEAGSNKRLENNKVVTVEEDEKQETKETEETEETVISIEEVVKNDYMNDKGYTSEDQLTEEDKQFIQAELENASLDEEAVKKQVQDKIRGDTYLQEKYQGMDINDIIMSPTFGNDFADIYDNIVVGDTEQKTVENETTGTVETTGDTETTEFEGERYGDSEREILDYIFQASDEDLDKLKQLKKDRNFITKNKVGNDKILKAADEDTAGSGKVTSEQYYELDSSLRNDYTEVIDWNTGESFYIRTDWINRSEGQRANDLRRKRESGSITAEEIEELEKLDTGYHIRDVLTRADVYMNTKGHPGGQTKQYTGGLEEVNQFINNRRTLIIETGKDPEIQLSPEQTEIYNKVIDENYDESNLETDFEIFYNQPIVYRTQIVDEDGRITYEGDEFLTTPSDVTTTVTGPPTTDTDKQQIPPVVTREDVRTLGDIGQEVLKGTMAAARGVLDAFGGPDALVSAVMGKKALGVAMQDLNPQEKAKLSPMFNEQLRQSKELTKRGFHPSQERKIRKDISQAYNQGLDNAVRGTAGDRAKFLATSGILDRNRASALLEFAALDSQQQIANQDRYNQLLQFKETFDAQQKESLRSENLELALANKKAASQFAGIALGDTMSRLSDLADNEINRALKNEMFNRYNYMFNTDKTNPYLTSTINPE